MIAAKIVVSGLVQGVFFRAHTVQEARRSGVVGYVKNLNDGNVEAWFQGDDVMVERLIDWCRKGPPRARVDSVDVSFEAPNLTFQEFDIR